MVKITAVIPIRSGSQRVKDKTPVLLLTLR